MGIPIVGATDATYNSDQGLNVAENAAGLVGIGLSPIDAIKAITAKAAQCLKIDTRTGIIRKGWTEILWSSGKNR